MRVRVEHKLRINYEEIQNKLKHDREIVASAINKFFAIICYNFCSTNIYRISRENIKNCETIM